MKKTAGNFKKLEIWVFIVVLLAFAAVTLFINTVVAIAEASVTIVLIIYALISAKREQQRLISYIEEVTYNTESAKSSTLMNFPLPMSVFRLEDNTVVWGNQVFFSMLGYAKPKLNVSMNEFIPDFSSKWLKEGKNRFSELVKVGDRKYQLHGNIISGKDSQDNSGFMGISYWIDVTEYDNIKQEYENSRPVVAVIIVDNYDELMKPLSDKDKVLMRGSLDDAISQWVEGKGGMMRRYDRDRYIFIFENRYLDSLREDKFSVLESIHEIHNHQGIHATLSIGTGIEGNDYEEDYKFATLAAEMALSRGGDQAVIKNRRSFEFFGGRGGEIETRTKVKSRVTANALAGFVKECSQVYIMGHKMSDLDSVGAAVGMGCIARKLGKPFSIVIDRTATASNSLLKMLSMDSGYPENFITPDEAMMGANSKTLLVVVDTNRPEQVESLPLLESCNSVAVIDHHRRAASYIENAAISFHEPNASSACELMSELLQELTEPGDIMKVEAQAMLAGIMLDTKCFTMRTGERTFDAAAFLKRSGADSADVKRLMQSDMEHSVAKYNILTSAKLYRDVIAISVADSPQDRVVAAQAADELLNIAGVTASIVCYPTSEGGTVVSARSIGEINVQLLLEPLGGGGNKSAAGAQIADMPIKNAVNRLFKSIDDYFDN